MSSYLCLFPFTYILIISQKKVPFFTESVKFKIATLHHPNTKIKQHTQNQQTIVSETK